MIEENRRIEVKGSITSLDNEPISGLNIFSAGSYEGNFSTNVDKTLGRGITDENGNFDFISLDTDSHGLILAINPVEIENDPEYSSAYFYDPSGEHSLSYELGDFVIPGIIEFQLDVRNVSGTGDTLKYVLDYQRPIQNFIFENGSFVEDEGGGPGFISIREHRPDSDPLSLNLSILEGSEFEFSYLLGDDPVERTSITVSAENNSYELEY